MRNFGRFIPLIVILALAGLIFAMGWHRYLSLDTLREHGGALREFARENYALSLLALVLIFALATASVVPGVFFLTITAGYLFGPWVGGVATALAATLGATVIYYVARTALGESLRKKAEANQGGMLQKICEGVDRDTFSYVLAARLVVTVPFHLINLAAGVISAPLRPYLGATFLGLLPAHLIYCWIGSGLSEVLARDADPDLTSLMREFALPLAGVALLAIVLPLAFRLWRKRRGAAPA
ncbi:TVP38/TMEM64 family protein [Brevundimonas sp.]|uniref:TVP38/TMEM64 family protein n=1 Tax=Brevundimonas sp. TaxID=1871086 RepID=UPI0035B3022A